MEIDLEKKANLNMFNNLRRLLRVGQGGARSAAKGVKNNSRG